MKPIATPSEPGDYFARFKDLTFSQRVWPVEVVWLSGEKTADDAVLIAKIGIKVYPLSDFDFYDGDS